MEQSNSSRNTHYGTIFLYAEYSNLLTFSYKQQALKKTQQPSLCQPMILAVALLILWNFPSIPMNPTP